MSWIDDNGGNDNGDADDDDESQIADPFAFEAPMDETQLIALSERVKQTSMAHYAQGTLSV
jgi:hypothetical protein